jgi:hypothetical protein
MINPFSDVDWNPDTPAKRKFAKSLMIGFPVLAVVFLLLGLLRTGMISTKFFPVAGVGFALGVVLWFIPQIARPFYLAWYFIACCIGIVLSNVLFALFFYVVFTPTGWLLRMFRRDTMNRPLDRQSKTYWQEVENVVDPESYFRQF